MTWEQLLSLLAVAVTGILGWLTYRRSRRSDEVLDVAANIKTTFDAQAEINHGLREDVKRLREAHQLCEEATNDLRRSLANSHLIIDAQTRETAQLKATVAEHELTISRHERTINELRVQTNSKG